MKRTSIAVLAFVLFPLAVSAQQRIALREGLIIDPTQPVAYVMTPERGIAAIDLITGGTRWTSTAAAKPLAIVGNRLVGQVESAALTNRLELVSIDVQERGRVAARNAAELPGGVRVTVGESLAGTFISTAQADGSNVLVTWRWTADAATGMKEDAGDDDANRISPKAVRRITPVIGGVRMNPATGAMTRVSTERVIPGASSPWLLAASQRLRVDDGKGVQYESADGKHVLVSERAGDDRTWDKYRWVVFDRVTGQKLGETRSHVSFAPFVVRDSILVFETTPYTAPKSAEQQAKLRGVSLDTGREKWSVPVREVVFRGLTPP